MVTVHLPEILDIRAASPLVGELLHARGHHLTIDASNVRKIGAQCVQALLSARATWTVDGYSLVVVEPSESFLDTLQTLGIAIGEISEQEPAR